LKRIVDNGHRASEIIASIRAMFRKDGGTAAALDVNELVRDVLALVQGEIESHAVVLQRHLLDQPPTIVGERVPLQQVLLNLIMNAVEAMGSLTDRPRVLSVGTQMSGAGILISVADCGVGIDADNMDRIFEAFFTTKPQGMGMGLSICRSIVEAHGGRLWAVPASPHGAIFNVQLPIAAPT